MSRASASSRFSTGNGGDDSTKPTALPGAALGGFVATMRDVRDAVLCGPTATQAQMPPFWPVVPTLPVYLFPTEF